MIGPAQVRQRDGTLDPFDADRICAGLFAVGVRIGRPDAFLARELTDGVVHFLADETGILAVDDLRETVIKIIRELGQPHLARAYEDVTTPRPAPSSDAVFAPEVRAAHESGHLVLLGPDASRLLAGSVLPWPRRADAIVDPGVAEMLVVDGPEHWLAEVGTTPADLIASLARVARPIVVNLNLPTPPRDVGTPTGPLFAPPILRPLAASDLLRFLVQLPNVRVFWHVSADPATTEAVAMAREGLPVQFAFARRRRAPRLAEGIDRDEPALLLRVAVRLPRLLGELGKEPDGEALLAKVGSLARLALSAGVQKRASLRRHRADLTGGFLLDRARLQVIPLGLDVVAMRVTGRSPAHGGASLEIARKILQRLRDVLRDDGRKVQLTACLDDAPPGTLPDDDAFALGACDSRADLTKRLRSASALHAITERGLVPLPFRVDPLSLDPASDIDRVCFRRGETA